MQYTQFVGSSAIQWFDDENSGWYEFQDDAAAAAYLATLPQERCSKVVSRSSLTEVADQPGVFVRSQEWLLEEGE